MLCRFVMRAVLVMVMVAVVAPQLHAQSDFSFLPNGPRKSTFANLAAVTDGAVRYCTDCTPNTSPCTASGSGAFADRVGSAWVCRPTSAAASGTVTSIGLAGTTNQITVTGTSPITTSGSWTLSFPAGGVTLPATTTGTFSGNLTGNVTGNTSGTSGSTTGNAATASASDHTPTACGANTFAQSQSTVWSFTCASLVLAGAQFANQGTTTTVAHGNAAGNPSWGSVVSADLNITTTTCTNQFLSAISATGTGTCTGLTLAAFPTIATNTVLGNATSGTAVPTALAVGTCSAAGSALNWTTNTGFGCNTSIAANTATTATTATNATNTAITDDTSTNATVFPTWVATASGNQAQKTSSTLLTFNPSSGNVGIGTTPNAASGRRLDVLQTGNQLTVLDIKNADAASTGAAALVKAEADVAIAQISAFGSGFSGTLFGLNLAGQSSVNNGAVGSVGLTIGTTNGLPVRIGTNSTRALTIDATTQAVSLRGTQTNDNATTGDAGEFTNAQCPGPTTTATITVTIASPGVVTWSSHPFNGTAPRFDACPVVFTTGGALPTGITASTTYWVVPTTISGNNFSIATSVANAIAGTSINTSGSQSGTHTGTAGSVLTTATAKDVTGLALTAGNWDCSALLARGLGGTTSVTLLKTSISTTSATDGTVPAGTMNQFAQAASVPANDVDESIGPIDLRNSGTTNTFLVADDTFTLSTNKAYGTIRCRRMR